MHSIPITHNKIWNVVKFCIRNVILCRVVLYTHECWLWMNFNFPFFIYIWLKCILVLSKRCLIFTNCIKFSCVSVCTKKEVGCSMYSYSQCRWLANMFSGPTCICPILPNYDLCWQILCVHNFLCCFICHLIIFFICILAWK